MNCSDDLPHLYGLIAVVHYRGKDFGGWRAMAAFDVVDLAEQYAADCTGDGRGPWEYRVVEIDPDTMAPVEPNTQSAASPDSSPADKPPGPASVGSGENQSTTGSSGAASAASGREE